MTFGSVSCRFRSGPAGARPSPGPEIFDPVCGCDGMTYSNFCFAAMAGVNVRSAVGAGRPTGPGSRSLAFSAPG